VDLGDPHAPCSQCVISPWQGLPQRQLTVLSIISLNINNPTTAGEEEAQKRNPRVPACAARTPWAFPVPRLVKGSTWPCGGRRDGALVGAFSGAFSFQSRRWRCDNGDSHQDGFHVRYRTTYFKPSTAPDIYQGYILSHEKSRRTRAIKVGFANMPAPPSPEIHIHRCTNART